LSMGGVSMRTMRMGDTPVQTNLDILCRRLPKMTVSRLLNGALHRIFGLLLRLEQFSFLSWDERTCVFRSPLRG
jgi:hypothetical protein